jgi:hypothetical protein
VTYHLHTEDKGNLDRLAVKFFDGYTIQYAMGYWKGQPEAGAIIEVSTDDADQVRRLAEAIKAENHQDAVLIEAFPSDQMFV